MKTPDINKWLREHQRACQYGAPLGRRQQYGEPPREAFRYCQRVRFVDGCYSPDGTYWGGPANLWAVFTADFETLCFYRAATRRDALQEYWTEYNNGCR